jgi:hypothetical protein
VTVVTSARLPCRSVTAGMFFTVVEWGADENGCDFCWNQEPAYGLIWSASCKNHSIGDFVVRGLFAGETPAPQRAEFYCGAGVPPA